MTGKTNGPNTIIDTWGTTTIGMSFRLPRLSDRTTQAAKAQKAPAHAVKESNFPIPICDLRASVFAFIDKWDNVRDHRAGTSDHPFQKHAQGRLRVHHIVIWRLPLNQIFV